MVPRRHTTTLITRYNTHNTHSLTILSAWMICSHVVVPYRPTIKHIMCYNNNPTIRTHFTCLDMSTDVLTIFAVFNIWYQNVTSRLSVRGLATSYSDYAIHMCHVIGLSRVNNDVLSCYYTFLLIYRELRWV